MVMHEEMLSICVKCRNHGLLRSISSFPHIIQGTLANSKVKKSIFSAFSAASRLQWWWQTRKRIFLFSVLFFFLVGVICFSDCPFKPMQQLLWTNPFQVSWLQCNKICFSLHYIEDRVLFNSLPSEMQHSWNLSTNSTNVPRRARLPLGQW